MSAPTIDTIKNLAQAQQQFNAGMEELVSTIYPQYGAMLPAAEGVDGRLFIVQPSDWYQLRSGAWVAL